MKMQITFKSGAQIVADAGELTTGRDPLTGELTRMNWTTPDSWTAKLHTISLAEVAAVVMLRDTEPTTSDRGVQQ